MAWVWSEEKRGKGSRPSSNRKLLTEIQPKLENPENFPAGEDARPRKYYIPDEAKRLSERQEYDFMHTANITTLTAPYGTNDTPTISYKIIGSKPVHVIESVQPHSVPDSTFYQGPRIHSIHGVTEKPNQVNADVLRESAKDYYTAQQAADDPYAEEQFTSQIHGKPTHSNPITERSRRPDSKLLSPHKRLPPIEANRDKNKKSTVFEKEPWIKHRNDNKLATNTEYKTHFELRPHSDKAKSDNGSDNQINGYHNNRSHSDYTNGYNNDMSKSNLNELCDMLPPGHYLPSDPVNFNTRQKELLLDITSNDLRTEGTTTDDIKSAYQILSRFDRELSGWVPMAKVQDALRQCRADPAYDTLRCIAAMYVHPKYQGQVNYEDITRFLNEAIKLSHDGKRINSEKTSNSYECSVKDLKLDLYTSYNNVQSEQHSRDYHDLYDVYEGVSYDRQDPFPVYKEPLPRIADRPSRHSPDSTGYDKRSPLPQVRNISIPREKETAMLLSKTAQQLGNHRIDMERLIQMFQTVDADRREMLAASEIKNVLYDNRIQLQESLVNDILMKMEGSNRDGKYSWKRFVEFLERVQPTKTGLEITYNKRPLEYAKQYPQPVDSWPRAKESPRMSPPPGAYQNYSPRRNSPHLSRREPELPPLSNRKDYGYTTSPPPSRREFHSPRRNIDNGPRYKYPRPSEEIWRKIQAVEEEIKELEGNNKYLRQGLESDTRGDSWESKLIQLAGILYSMDEAKYKSTGRLYYETIVDYTRNHNQYANMQIPDEVIYNLAQKHMNDRNMVDIARYMEDLGDRRMWFKKK